MDYYCQKSHIPITTDHYGANICCYWFPLLSGICTEEATSLITHLHADRKNKEKYDSIAIAEIRGLVLQTSFCNFATE